MNNPNAHSSVLRFTLDGRPSVEDIHDLFSTLLSQLTCSTHKLMFRSYSNSFTSEQAISVLGSSKFTQVFQSNTTNLTAQIISNTSPAVYTINVGMSKALIQQFLWTRLILNASEPRNRTYRDKGVWRISSKGLCVLQDFCIKTKINIDKFGQYVNASSQLMFVIQVERTKENDRLSCKRRHLASLFAIMIASLPLKKNSEISNQDTYPDQIGFSEDSYIGSPENSIYSGYESSSSLRELSFSDYFPNMTILANDMLVCAYGDNQQFTKSYKSSQQKTLLQNLRPSSSKVQMRTIFTSLLCCNWLVEYCSVASNDEAESIMTSFMRLGWITFYEDKNKNSTQIEASSSTTLNLTKSGMKVVIDISIERQRDAQNAQLHSQQLQKLCSFENDSSEYVLFEKPYSTLSSATTATSIDFRNTSYTSHANEEKNNYYTKTRPPLPSFDTSSTDGSILSSPSDNNFKFSSIFDSKPLSIPPSISNLSISTSGKNDYYNLPSPMNSCEDPIQGSLHLMNHDQKEINTIKLNIVLANPHLRSLFRNFLDDRFCGEMLEFWFDYNQFKKKYLEQKASLISTVTSANLDQFLEDSFTLWETYLRPDAQHEVKINTALQNEMAREIPSMMAVIETTLPNQSKASMVIATCSTSHIINKISSWFNNANNQVIELMATEPITEFTSTAQYKLSLQQFQQQQTGQLNKESSISVKTSLKKKSTILRHTPHVVEELTDFPSPPQREDNHKEILHL